MSTSTVSSRLPDGRWQHDIHQSMLESFLTCPERSRRQIYGITERTDTDSTALGTAFHRTIEETINLAIEDVWISTNDVLDLFEQHWLSIQEELDIRWVKRQLKGATSYGLRMSATFAVQVLPTLEPYATEVVFDQVPLIDEPERLVTLSGCVDYVDKFLGLVDWKSASRPYIEWMRARYGSQPLVYTYAMRGTPYCDDRFRFAVFPAPGNEVQYVDVVRGASWDQWLKDQILSVCYTLEGDLGIWPKNDQHPLCSEKWCEAWETCKGAALQRSVVVDIIGCMTTTTASKPADAEPLVQAPTAFVRFARVTNPGQYQKAEASISIPVELSSNGTGSTFVDDEAFWKRANISLNSAKLEVLIALGLDHAMDDEGNVQEKGAQVTATATNVVWGVFPGATEVTETPSCPICKGAMWDNREGKRNPKAPDFKCKANKETGCEGVIWPPKK